MWCRSSRLYGKGRFRAVGISCRRVEWAVAVLVSYGLVVLIPDGRRPGEGGAENARLAGKSKSVRGPWALREGR